MARKRRAKGEGSVHFSENKACWVWRAVAGHKPDGSVRYVEGRAPSQREALRRKQAAERANRQPHADRETVGEHLDHWLEDIARPHVRRNTWIRYESVVRLHLKPRIGGVPLRELSVSAVTRLWASMRRDGMSAGNVKTCGEVLASALEAAVAEEKIAVAPTRGAAKPRVIREKVQVFNDDEVRAILRASRTDPLESFYKLAVGTGARQGELFALLVEDFDLDRGTVHITKMLDQRKGGAIVQPPKSENGNRTLGLPAFAVDALRDHMKGRGPGLAFTTSEGTHLHRSNFVRRDWAGLLKSAGVPYRKFHTLRHTHASRLLAEGVDPAEVARRLGDKIETVMRVYAHWIPTVGRDTAARIDSIYNPPPPRLVRFEDENPKREDPEAGRGLQGGGKGAVG